MKFIAYSLIYQYFFQHEDDVSNYKKLKNHIFLISLNG